MNACYVQLFRIAMAFFFVNNGELNLEDKSTVAQLPTNAFSVNLYPSRGAPIPVIVPLLSLQVALCDKRSIVTPKVEQSCEKLRQLTLGRFVR